MEGAEIVSYAYDNFCPKYPAEGYLFLLTRILNPYTQVHAWRLTM